MIYLGLGCNLGNRLQNLEHAVQALVREGFRLKEVSPWVETPALLPENAESSWLRPYLNIVVCGHAPWTPMQGLHIARSIEQSMGREPAPRWSPRAIDIDLLLWHDEKLAAADLTLPHPGIASRNFVLSPLLYLYARQTIPGNSQTVFTLTQTVRPAPLWMGILNLTPDSFSDAGRWQDWPALESEIDDWFTAGVPIIDVGAESTRPGAQALTPETEWRRLQPVLSLLQEKRQGKRVCPKISLDSRNWQTVERALPLGIDIINDVGGLSAANMQCMVVESGLPAIAMHSTSIPADPKNVLAGCDATAQVVKWIADRRERWQQAGMDLARIWVDPGIGFGKTALQSVDLLKNCTALRRAGFPLVVGHSRKSFMAGFADVATNRDLETLGISLALMQQGVDILRVHDPLSHLRAARAWSHIG